MQIAVMFDRYGKVYRDLPDNQAQELAAIGRRALIEQADIKFNQLNDADKTLAFLTLLNAYENQKSEYSALAGSVNSLVWQVKELRVKLRQQGVSKLSREIDPQLLGMITDAVEDYE